jgi:hypothetical protein
MDLSIQYGQVQILKVGAGPQGSSYTLSTGVCKIIAQRASSDRLELFVFQRCRLLLLVNVKKKQGLNFEDTVYGADTHTQYAVPKRTFYTQPCVLSNTQSNTQ